MPHIHLLTHLNGSQSSHANSSSNLIRRLIGHLYERTSRSLGVLCKATAIRVLSSVYERSYAGSILEVLAVCIDYCADKVTAYETAGWREEGDVLRG